MHREKDHKRQFSALSGQAKPSIVPDVAVLDSEAERLCDAAAKGQVLKAKAILEKMPGLINAINSKGSTVLVVFCCC
jgi:hypothetical protein